MCRNMFCIFLNLINIFSFCINAHEKRNYEQKSTHLRLIRPSMVTESDSIEMKAQLLDKKNQSGLQNKQIIFRFNQKEIGRRQTDALGFAVIGFLVPKGLKNNSDVSIDAEFIGDSEYKRDIVTGKLVYKLKNISVISVPAPAPNPTRPPTSAPSPIVPVWNLIVSDAVFYDKGTIVKYYGNVKLEARITKDGKGVNGSTVTFEIGPNVNPTGDMTAITFYTIRAITDVDGYARISLENATWKLPSEGPWYLRGFSGTLKGNAKVTLQKIESN